MKKLRQGVGDTQVQLKVANREVYVDGGIELAYIESINKLNGGTIKALMVTIVTGEFGAPSDENIGDFISIFYKAYSIGNMTIGDGVEQICFPGSSINVRGGQSFYNSIEAEELKSEDEMRSYIIEYNKANEGKYWSVDANAEADEDSEEGKEVEEVRAYTLEKDTELDMGTPRLGYRAKVKYIGASGHYKVLAGSTARPRTGGYKEELDVRDKLIELGYMDGNTFIQNVTFKTISELFLAVELRPYGFDKITIAGTGIKLQECLNDHDLYLKYIKADTAEVRGVGVEEVGSAECTIEDSTVATPIETSGASTPECTIEDSTEDTRTEKGEVHVEPSPTQSNTELTSVDTSTLIAEAMRRLETKSVTVELGATAANAFREIMNAQESILACQLAHAESLEKQRLDSEHKSKQLNAENKAARFSWSTSHYESKAPALPIGLNIDKVEASLESRKALLFDGVPGTGKTTALRYVLHHLTDDDTSRYAIVSFHQEFEYSDFIGGVRNVAGAWQYVDGIMTTLCKRADADRENNYYIGLDEFSRGNTEAILGEVLTAMESRDTLITLSNGELFMVPSNLYILGTMNTSDDSTKRIDKATYERFGHYTLLPQWGNEEYTKNICGDAHRGVSSALRIISNKMVTANNLISTDRTLGSAEIIGTRAISIRNMTSKLLSDAVKTVLIKQLEVRAKRGSEQTRNGLTAIIDSIEECISDEA